jgi:hypothetical protein
LPLLGYKKFRVGREEKNQQRLIIFN